MNLIKYVVVIGLFLLQSSCSKGSEQDSPETGKPKVSTITINWTSTMQTLTESGINFEGYHITGGNEMLAPKFEAMMSSLPTHLARIGLPLGTWEPTNDNDDPTVLDLNSFQDIKGANYTFRRIQELKSRGIASWLSIWDMGVWNISNPAKSSGHLIINLDEMAESIGTFLLHAKEKYKVEPLYVSVNEPTIASENGWGGYNIALTAAEQISLIAKAGAWFEQHNIQTKWIIALHKIYPSELAQAQDVFNNASIRKYIAAFDFHSYSMQKPEFEPYLKKWYEWSKTTGIPTFCGECDYDNQFWLNPDREKWVNAAMNYGILIHRLVNLAHVNAILPWYANSADATRPYRYVAKHFMETFKKGTVVVESSSSNPSLLVIAGKLEGKYIIQIQNTSTSEIFIQIKDLPLQKLNWICSKDNSYYESLPIQSLTNGALEVKLSPSSLNTFSEN